MQYVAMSESEARELSVPQFEEATKALLCQRLDQSELIGLLTSANTAVRGTAILERLDHPAPNRTAALHKAAPWALELPEARGSSMLGQARGELSSPRGRGFRCRLRDFDAFDAVALLDAVRFEGHFVAHLFV